MVCTIALEPLRHGRIARGHAVRGVAAGGAVAWLHTLRSMSAMASSVIVVASFALVALLGIAGVAALFWITRRPSAGSPQGSDSGD